MKILILIFFSFTLMNANNIKIPASFSAKFTQKVTTDKKKVIKYSGNILLNNGGKMKWSYRQPTKKEVCSSKNIFMVVDHDLEQVSFYKVDKALNLSHILKSAKLYKGRLYTARFGDSTYTFSLDKKGQISQLAFKDSLDNVVNIHFLDMKYSNKINSSKNMKCPYPKAYDLIGK